MKYSSTKLLLKLDYHNNPFYQILITKLAKIFEMVGALVGRNLVGENLAIGIDLGIVGNMNVGKLTGIDGSLGSGVYVLEQEEEKVLLGFYSKRCRVVDYFDPLTKCPVQSRDSLQVRNILVDVDKDAKGSHVEDHKKD